MLRELQNGFSGELYFDDSVKHNAIKLSYSTDASVYQEKPLAVAIPKSIEDLRKLVQFASEKNLTIIPRAAGTSLAGQVVGNGIVADISRYFNSILELNMEEKWVRVQPGVIRDDLNAWLRPQGLMFGPETSTASRAMIGGMIGNNSCGLHSIIWGDTRQSVMELDVILADGTETTFGDLDQTAFEAKCAVPGLEGHMYRSLKTILLDPANRKEIAEGFPKQGVHRRNTGYALDMLLPMLPFAAGSLFNLSKLVAGSEGTLCFITAAKLRLQALPPREKCIVAVHTVTVKAALQANIIALDHGCSASELVDDIILEFTKGNIDQSKNRFFVEGNPRAILMVEFFGDSITELQSKAFPFVDAIREKGLAYALPVLYGADTDSAWELRKAGLGLLRNEPGDTQPVNLIEDCAVDPLDLPDYIDEVEALLKRHDTRYSMYAHAGAGELHVEPMINLKSKRGPELFRTILGEVTQIVKKYRGSLSGEHGDGRLRGEFIPFVMGEKNYGLFRQVKSIFDPKAVFNRGKVVDTPPMNAFLRYESLDSKKEIKTLFDFSAQEGILHLAEKCSGSGDCRRSHISGGTMCPSFMATRDERDSTRARANLLRHYYTQKSYGVDRTVSEEEVREVLDLCLSCKGCKAECPSAVDVGKMKAEFTQEYYDMHGIPLRSKLVGHFTRQMKLASIAPGIYNLVFGTPWMRRMVNRAVGFHPARSMPLLQKTTFRKWFKDHKKRNAAADTSNGIVHLFCDEFSDYNDVALGQKMILLLERLGYEVRIPDHLESGRTYLSKGMVKNARDIANENVGLLKDLVSVTAPVVGIEPSAILTLRDEYPELVSPERLGAAKRIAAHTFLFEEWFSRELNRGAIRAELFRPVAGHITIHGHCHQKSLSSTDFIRQALSIVPGYNVTEIASGCCGMAGSFGYEKEHYEVSMRIGELVLFPSIRKLGDDVIIAASGTSCRHQIKDGTGRRAMHTAEILFDALADQSDERALIYSSFAG